MRPHQLHCETEKDGLAYFVFASKESLRPPNQMIFFSFLVITKVGGVSPHPYSFNRKKQQEKVKSRFFLIRKKIDI